MCANCFTNQCCRAYVCAAKPIGNGAAAVEANRMNDNAWAVSDQERAPLLEALARHSGRRPQRWHTPGHKGVWTDPVWRETLGPSALSWDLTELTGLDNLHQPDGPIAAAETLAASLYGGDRAFFLVNGASAGLLAVLLSLSGTGPVLLPRHVHRAIVGGLILADRVPCWLQPDLIGPWSLPAGPAPAAIKEALAAARPDLAVLIHPTYHGYTADLGGAIATCHEAGVPVLVDAAHGAHLRFHPDLPPDPLALGADAVVYSFHKTLGALTGAAVLVVRRGRLDPDRIQAALTLVQTSSPSYLLLASLDAARREAARSASDRLAKLLPALADVRAQWRAAGIAVAERAGLPPGYSHDPTKLLFSLAAFGLSGAETAAALHERGVDLEMAEAAYALALTTPADTDAALQQLASAVTALTERNRSRTSKTSVTRPATLSQPPLPTAVMRPAEAYRRPRQAVPLAQAAGRVAATLVSVSPPGIANLVPGERIDAEAVSALEQALADGLVVQGIQSASDPAVMVVAS